MNGSIAQIVALACHANSVLQERPTQDFFATNSTCQFCNAVEFVRLKRRWIRRAPKEVLLASNPDEWFQELKSRACRAVFIQHMERNQAGISDRMSAVFVGGGGRWLLEAYQGDVSDYYEGRWIVSQPEAPDKRIWRVTYGLVGSAPPTCNRDATGFHRIKAEMASTLSRIEEFARRHNLDGFAGCFRRALDCLESDQPFESVYHRDLAPVGLLTREAAQIAAACQAAWVFGGMGSWNDLGFEGTEQEEYESVSDRLFELVNRAICEVANSTVAQHWSQGQYDDDERTSSTENGNGGRGLRPCE